MCAIIRKPKFYWLALLPTSKWLFSFLIYCLELLEAFFFFFFNLTSIYFSSSLRLKQWKERNSFVGPNSLYETLTSERFKLPSFICFVVLVGLTLFALSKHTDLPAATASCQKPTALPSSLSITEGFKQDNTASHFELTSLSVSIT